MNIFYLVHFEELVAGVKKIVTKEEIVSRDQIQLIRHETKVTINVRK